MTFRNVDNKLVIGSSPDPNTCRRAVSVSGCTNVVVSLCHRHSTKIDGRKLEQKDWDAIPQPLRDQLTEALKIEPGTMTPAEASAELKKAIDAV